MRRSILALSALFLSLTSYAGNERGNGGDVVVCRNTEGKVISTQMLDLYEGWQLRGLEAKLGGKDLNLEEKIELLLFRISTRSKDISNLLEKEINQFKYRAVYLSDVILNDIPDSDHLYILKGCEIKQIAIQGHIYGRGPHDDRDRDIIVDLELFNQLDDDNQLALMLHEVLYTLAIKKGHENSRRVRMLVSGFMSKEFDIMNPNEFWNLIKETAILNSSK